MNKTQDQSLDRILESAVVLSWADLVFNAQSSLIQIEYGFAPSGTLDYLKVWCSIARGHWLLACSYWMLPSKFHQTGVHFDNSYHSDGLAHILDFAMQHQNIFVLPPNLGRQGFFRFQFLHQRRAEAAEESVSLAFAHVESRLAQPALDRMAS
jgi:hypothetical protein